MQTKFSFIKGGVLGSRFVLVLGFVLLALLSGLVASTGGNQLTYGLIGLVAAAFLAAVPSDLMIEILAITCCLVIGQLIYFGNLLQALWIPYALAMLIYIKLPGAYLQSPFAKHKQLHPPFLLLLLCFFATFIAAIIVSEPSPLQVLAGGKNYTVLWAIYLAIALFAISEKTIEKLFSWLLPLALLQVPFVLYQTIFVASQRSTRGGKYGVAWDAIVGSFGGDPNTGGASGVMAYYLMVGVVYLFALWRKQLASLKPLLAVIAIAGISLALAEVKVVIVLLPISITIVQLPELVKRPLLAISSIITTLLLMVTLVVGYDHLHYAEVGQESKSVGDLVDKTFGYSTDPDFINFETGEMGRITSLTFWYTESARGDMSRMIFGYGPGATRSRSILTIGELAQKYPFRLDRSTASTLLWEIGPIGTGIFFLMMLYAAIKAYKAAKFETENPRRQATLETISAIMATHLVMYIYGHEMTEVPAQSFILMVSLGYLSQVISRQNMARMKLPEAP